MVALVSQKKMVALSNRTNNAPQLQNSYTSMCCKSYKESEKSFKTYLFNLLITAKIHLLAKSSKPNKMRNLPRNMWQWQL
jgi:hypothetical protein